MKYIGILLVLAVIGVITYFVHAPQGDDQPQSSIENIVGAKGDAEETIARAKCIELCKVKTIESSEAYFNLGPCLSGQIIPDWACDVAHNPRQAVDNDPVNQCPEFIAGQAHHFVEVDINCNFINSY
ncbi:hypothetical protein KKA15_06390 [Patescibacteria group bacterium]|nr:hypothetical protein [Patescibacteria group bacterium]